MKLISNGQNLAKQTQRKIYPSKILFQTKINLNQEEIFLSTERHRSPNLPSYRRKIPL